MSFAYLLIPVFLLIITLIQTNFLAYATEQAIIPTGATDESGCQVLHGMVINQTINSQTTSFCKFESKIILYSSSKGLITMPALSSWVDPHTRITYTFPDLRISPISNNATGTYYVGEKLFNILVRPTGHIEGNDLILVPQQAKIEIISWGNAGNNSLTVSFPRELLSGELRVMVDGNSTDSHIETTGLITTVTIPLDFSGSKSSIIVPNTEFNGRKIEITGTQMIPEFPYSLLILVTGIVGVLAVRQKWQTLV
ncbi:MAG: hypothetical protein E6K87_04115 [Thaumarchaeota archaeon]|nr:MAG: hypothetical protein E6K87_04115 [Nitrososphaerota archaeon]